MTNVDKMSCAYLIKLRSHFSLHENHTLLYYIISITDNSLFIILRLNTMNCIILIISNGCFLFNFKGDLFNLVILNFPLYSVHFKPRLWHHNFVVTCHFPLAHLVCFISLRYDWTTYEKEEHYLFYFKLVSCNNC